MNEASEAYEKAVGRAHRRSAIARALKTWEAWAIAGTVAYFAVRFYPWAAAGFPVVGR